MKLSAYYSLYWCKKLALLLKAILAVSGVGEIVGLHLPPNASVLLQHPLLKSLRIMKFGMAYKVVL